MTRRDGATWIVLGADADRVTVIDLDDAGDEIGRDSIARGALGTLVSERDGARSRGPRWVWSDTPTWYDALLFSGHRVGRCHDLRLCHALLRDSSFVEPDAAVRTSPEWDAAAATADAGAALFELADGAGARVLPHDADEVLAEFRRQRAAIAGSRQSRRLTLLTAAESAGALIAAEMRAAGLPWDVAEHDRLLTTQLGARPAPGARPARLEEAARRVRDALGDPAASLDSQPKLLRALHRAGVFVESTSRWELARQTHPVVAPLLEYKKLSRLLSANGWAWLSEWVADGRFRPVYVPAGVVTGRWASSGGGALQIPRGLRAAVRADPGWRLVTADVAQLEPRVLAGMARDAALARAARGADLYAGVVAGGAVSSRDEAKVAILGAMYGATSGDAGRLMPRLRRAYPRAMALVDDAAAAGETGATVSTLLGRTCPPPSDGWRALQTRAAQVGGEDLESRARRAARDRGRFTRNFVVQGTAAEWSLVWLAEVRRRISGLSRDSGPSADRSGPAFAHAPHLAFYLHDEIIVHTPAAQAEEVERAVREAAEAAGRMLFGDFAIDFPLDVRVADSAAKD